MTWLVVSSVLSSVILFLVAAAAVAYDRWLRQDEQRLRRLGPVSVTWRAEHETTRGSWP